MKKVKRKRKACSKCGRIELIPIIHDHCLSCDTKEALEMLKAKKEAKK